MDLGERMEDGCPKKAGDDRLSMCFFRNRERSSQRMTGGEAGQLTAQSSQALAQVKAGPVEECSRPAKWRDGCAFCCYGLLLDALFVESDGSRVLLQSCQNGQGLVQLGTTRLDPTIASADVEQ